VGDDSRERGEDAAFLSTMESAGRYNGWLVGRGLPYAGRRLLDVGAGTGVFTETFAERCDEVVAVEPDGALQAELERRLGRMPNVRVVHGDLGALPQGQRFDTVACFNVLEHIDDDVGVLRSFRERLEPGGALLLLVPAHPSLYGPMDRTVGHRRRYTRQSLGRALANAGYDVDVLRLVNPVGALGWLVAGRIARRREIPTGPLSVYDHLVPLLRALDRLRLPFGLSVWAVARAPS
jgi:SAM-dependent methyltransferase